MINKKIILKSLKYLQKTLKHTLKHNGSFAGDISQFFGWKPVQSTLSNSHTSAFAVEPISICAPKALQFLSFTLGPEECGIDSQKVRELRGYDTDRLMSSDKMGLIEKLAA